MARVKTRNHTDIIEDASELTIWLVSQIRHLAQDGMPYQQIAKYAGTKVSVIEAVVQNEVRLPN